MSGGTAVAVIWVIVFIIGAMVGVIAIVALSVLRKDRKDRKDRRDRGDPGAADDPDDWWPERDRRVYGIAGHWEDGPRWPNELSELDDQDVPALPDDELTS
jgi:hypothetical protein